MKPVGSWIRWNFTLATLVFGVLTAVLVVHGVAKTGDNLPPRVSFSIATGSSSGTYFPVGAMIAGLISHPPGIGRCETPDVCGPAGLIANAGASEGSIANVLAVNNNDVSSGLAQADVVAAAVAGRGAFARSGPARNIRVIADLYPEAVHLVASTKANIHGVQNLRGKRVSLLSSGSGTIATARAVLAAYGLSEQSIHPNYDLPDRAIELLGEGKLDAVFFVGGAPVPLLHDIIARGDAVLVPITGPARDRLLKRDPYLTATTIPANTYDKNVAVDTVGVGALWITNDMQPDDRIYALVKALYNPVNRPIIEAGAGAQGALIRLPNAVTGTAAPLHPGAARFYREAGILRAPKAPSGKS